MTCNLNVEQNIFGKTDVHQMMAVYGWNMLVTEMQEKAIICIWDGNAHILKTKQSANMSSVLNVILT
jgi:hypothetical protein